MRIMRSGLLRTLPARGVLRNLLTLSLTGLCLSACGGAGAVLSSNAFCGVGPYRPGLVEAISPPLERWVLTINETGAVLCGWQPN